MYKKRKTTTNSSTASTRKYRNCTGVQLVSVIKTLQKQYATTAKSPAWKTVGGKTPAQRCRAIQQQVKAVAKLLQSKTVKQIDAKIKSLKTQMAKRYGVKASSPKATSPAVKRLTVKRRQVVACPTITKLMTICKGFKVSSYKNPKYSAKTYTYAKKKSTKKTRSSYRSTAKYTRQTTSLKKEIRSLKKRNSFMKRQVAKFRKQVAQLQRHFGTLNNKPKWKVVQSSKKVGKDVSNIVRFSNALSNAFSLRKAS